MDLLAYLRIKQEAACTPGPTGPSCKQVAKEKLGQTKQIEKNCINKHALTSKAAHLLFVPN